MCRKKEHNLDIQTKRKKLEKKLEKKDGWIEKFDENLLKHSVISKERTLKSDWILFILSSIVFIPMISFYNIEQHWILEIVMIPIFIVWITGGLLIVPSFYGGIAYFWLLVGKSVLEQQISELEEE